MPQLSLSVGHESQNQNEMQCFFALPTGQAKAAVIVLQEAFGVNSHIKEVAERFAHEGYLAIAPELYHRTAPAGFTCGYGDFNSASPHLAAITAEGIQQDLQTCYDWLGKKHQIKAVASVGYCLGGRASFLANAKVALTCAISYYGGRIAPTHLNLAVAQKSPLLFFWGGLDKHIPNEQIQTVNSALNEAKKVFTCVQISDADHGFFCNERPSYNAAAARQSWALTLQFLKDYNQAS